MNLQQWLAQQNPRFSDADIAAVIGDELIADPQGRDFSAIFHGDSYTKSWQGRQQIMVTLEVWTCDHLIRLHQWLRDQPACIEHYWLLVIGHAGISAWWQEYKKFWQVKSFNIQEIADLPFGLLTIRSVARQPIDLVWGRQKWYSDFGITQPRFDRQINYHAVYMAGRDQCSIESGYYKDYLACSMGTLVPSIKLDLCYRPISADDLAAWVDKETYWQDQARVDSVRQSRHGLDSYPLTPAPRDNIYAASVHLYQDSFATVARETTLRQPYACMGEKTLRAFYFGQYVIPTTLGSWDYLQSLGFWFDPEVVDLSFTRERDPILRLDLMMAALRQFVTTWSLADLQRHLEQHQRSYQHNSQLAAELVQLQSL